MASSRKWKWRVGCGGEQGSEKYGGIDSER